MKPYTEEGRGTGEQKKKMRGSVQEAAKEKRSSGCSTEHMLSQRYASRMITFQLSVATQLGCEQINSCPYNLNNKKLYG